MNVIRHNYIATYCDVVNFLGALRKKNERSMNLVLCQEPLSFVCAERDEIKRTCCEDPPRRGGRRPKSRFTGNLFNTLNKTEAAVATALWAVQSKDVMPLVPFTGHKPVATSVC